MMDCRVHGFAGTCICSPALLRPRTDDKMPDIVTIELKDTAEEEAFFRINVPPEEAAELPVVDGLHGQGVAEDEGDGFTFAQVGQPVPGKHALTADDDPLSVRFDGIEESARGGGQVLGQSCLAGVVEDVDEEASGVEIDAAVV